MSSLIPPLKKEIAYCVQTPGKVADYYTQCISEVADLYVLSWKDYDPAWENHFDAREIDGVTGRNVLCKIALDRGPYRYLVFLDDDVRIAATNQKDLTPFQLFEKFLREQEPAICGVANQTIGPGWSRRTGTHNSIHYLDQQLCAWHIETFGSALPSGLFAIEESWQYYSPPNNAITSILYPNHKFQYNEIFIKNTYEVRRNYSHYPRNHKAGSKYGTFDQFSNTYIKKALGPDIPHWESAAPVGIPAKKSGSYYFSKDELIEKGFNLESEILSSVMEEWEKIKPDWWEQFIDESKKFYDKNPEGDFWSRER